MIPQNAAEVERAALLDRIASLESDLGDLADAA